MPEVIYNSLDWRITRQPEGVTDPMVVRFHRTGGVRCLLDQNAAWTPNGWDARRWVPTTRKVPRHLLELVEVHMMRVSHG